MEADSFLEQSIDFTVTKSVLDKENDALGLILGKWNERLAFACAFELEAENDLTSTSKTLPQGVVICSPKLLGGREHIGAVLQHASEYWRRGRSLARNLSIDLLLRLTACSQIAVAVDASGISKTREIAVVGLCNSYEQIDESFAILTGANPNAQRNDDLLTLTREKASFLKQFHRLPAGLDDSGLLTALKEKPLLLAFSK